MARRPSADGIVLASHVYLVKILHCLLFCPSHLPISGHLSPSPLPLIYSPPLHLLSPSPSPPLSPPSKEDSSRGLDPRLLASFVQDVWDKYLELRTCVLARQGHESEALWLLQLEQWKDRLQELGVCECV